MFRLSVLFVLAAWQFENTEACVLKGHAYAFKLCPGGSRGSGNACDAVPAYKVFNCKPKFLLNCQKQAKNLKFIYSNGIFDGRVFGSYGQCQQACNSDSRCKYFTYVGDKHWNMVWKKTCWLFEKEIGCDKKYGQCAGKTPTTEHDWSGPKTCSVESSSDDWAPAPAPATEAYQSTAQEATGPQPEPADGDDDDDDDDDDDETPRDVSSAGSAQVWATFLALVIPLSFKPM